MSKLFKKVTISILVLILSFFGLITNVKAVVLKPVVLTYTTDGKKTVTLKWNNTNKQYDGVDPDSGHLYYEVYKNGSKIDSVNGDVQNDQFSTNVTLTNSEVESDQNFYIIVHVTRTINGGTADSPKSNTVTVKPSDFTTPPPDTNPPPANSITAPRVVGSINGTKVTLKWDRTTYSNCDDGASLYYKVYRDGAQLTTVSTNLSVYSYEDPLSGELATKSHSYYVTTYCTRVAGGTQPLESQKSNLIQYSPATADNPASVTNPDGIVYSESDINPDSGTTEDSECEKQCPSAGFLWRNAIGHAMCVAQCTVIEMLKGTLTWLVNSIIKPVLGLGGGTQPDLPNF